MSSQSSSFSAHCHALIPCAGSGSRLPGDALKQYRTLLGDCVVQHTVRAFLRTPRITSVAVVVQAGDTQAAACLQADPRLSILPLGGATRAHSVLGGLDGLLQAGAAPDDWALVHDAARCCITPELIDRLIDACTADAVGGLLALPLPDTLKLADSAGRVARTEPREGRWLAQTPQMFRIGALRAALQAAIAADPPPPPGRSQAGAAPLGGSEPSRTWGQQQSPPLGRPQAGAAPLGGSEHLRAWGQQSPPTDEAGAMERLGAKPLLAPGAAFNFKITYPHDLELAQAVLAARTGACTGA
ncbi:MAG: 2-C-methyl-D-erythritol 4-phosphate cytidylyltransferase [Thiomonas sp.]|nr:2-C-methyl-D-erythritol 4-phosphate cytidylyltransferase [Thiomonas sp.]